MIESRAAFRLPGRPVGPRAAPPDGSPGSRGTGTVRRLARALPMVLAVAALASLLVAVDPGSVLRSAAGFDLWLVLPLLLLAVGFYLLQGLRWHQLLDAVGVRQPIADSELINLAGQSVSAVLPLGDLTRALMVSASSGVEFGAAAATVTVQELTFTLLVVLAAVPGLGRLHDGVIWMLAVVAGVGAVIAILTVNRAFRLARVMVSSMPILRRLLGQIEALQREVRQLLSRPRVLAGSVIDLGRVMAATAAMMLILRGLHINSLGWSEAALVLAVAYVGGALSLLPGGVGANEASVIGMLVVLGVDPAAAAAAAILQRLWLSGFATLGGLTAYAVVHHRQLTRLGTADARASSARQQRLAALVEGPRAA